MTLMIICYVQNSIWLVLDVLIWSQAFFCIIIMKFVQCYLYTDFFKVLLKSYTGNVFLRMYVKAWHVEANSLNTDVNLPSSPRQLCCTFLVLQLTRLDVFLWKFPLQPGDTCGRTCCVVLGITTSHSSATQKLFS